MKIRRSFFALSISSLFALVGCLIGSSNTPTTSTGNTNATGSVVGTDACLSATSKWALWSGGTCLRGVNVWQTINNNSISTFYNGTLGTGPIGPPYTQADFNAIAAMGANVVNISGPGIYSETAPYALNTAAQTNLDNLLTMIQNANMFAVITFRSGPGRNEEDIVPQPGLTAINSVWSTQAEQDAWVAMWQYTANRYKNNPVVVGYDLMNEPHPNAQTVTPVPTSIPSEFYPAYANTLFDWNPLAKRISNAIRQVDTTTPILIGGMDWSGAAWLNSLTPNGDSKTVYMVHQYEPQANYTHQPAPYTNTYGTTTSSCGAMPCTFTRADLSTQFAYISSFKFSRNAPVGVNEFGVVRFQPGAAQYLSDEMDIMESKGLNYAIWAWDTIDPTFSTYDDFNFRRGTNPKNHVDVIPNVLTTTIQKYFQKNTLRPSNRSF